jgi:hypothetical protein
MKHKRLKVALAAFLFTLISSALFPFRAGETHFFNDFQYRLYLSWIERGSFSYDAPADLSADKIVLRFHCPHTERIIPVVYTMEGGKISNQREVISQVKLSDPSLHETERSYRPILETTLYRLNSMESIFVTDFLTTLEMELTIEEMNSTESFSYLFGPERLTERLVIESVEFFTIEGNNNYEYVLKIGEEVHLRLSIPVSLKSQDILASISLHEEDYHFPLRIIDRKEHDPTLPEEPVPAESTTSSVYTFIPPVLHQPFVPAFKTHSSIPITGVKISDFINNYYHYGWGREMLHNKIAEPERFLASEFPHHNISINDGKITLQSDLFQNRFSSNISLVKKNISDGIAFDHSSNYHLSDDHTLILATDEAIHLPDLTTHEIEIIAPYINQLVAMHRVIGTSMLNFLLIPADVPVTVVFRDPERMVTHFDSYTDILLMLSHYWQQAQVYFSVDRVKKVNSFFEIDGTLVAKKPDDSRFDIAEVRFSLDKDYRINVAMLVIHTDVFSALDE